MYDETRDFTRDNVKSVAACSARIYTHLTVDIPGIPVTVANAIWKSLLDTRHTRFLLTLYVSRHIVI